MDRPRTIEIPLPKTWTLRDAYKVAEFLQHVVDTFWNLHYRDFEDLGNDDLVREEHGQQELDFHVHSGPIMDEDEIVI